MLGIGFGMGLAKLSIKMTQSRIRALTKADQEILAQSRVTPYEGNEELHLKAGEILSTVKVVPGWDGLEQDYPDLQRACTYKAHHTEVFSKYWEWREQVVTKYQTYGYYSLVDGWTLLDGEKRSTSIANFPVQGTGGAILRRAVERCLYHGLEVIAPLHDCVYVVADPAEADAAAAVLVREMRQAVKDVCGSDFIRIEAKQYSTNWDEFISTWTEEKQAKEFREYGKYMVHS